MTASGQTSGDTMVLQRQGLTSSVYTGWYCQIENCSLWFNIFIIRDSTLGGVQGQGSNQQQKVKVISASLLEAVPDGS